MSHPDQQSFSSQHQLFCWHKLDNPHVGSTSLGEGIGFNEDASAGSTSLPGSSLHSNIHRNTSHTLSCLSSAPFSAYLSSAGDQGSICVVDSLVQAFPLVSFLTGWWYGWCWCCRAWQDWAVSIINTRNGHLFTSMSKNNQNLKVSRCHLFYSMESLVLATLIHWNHWKLQTLTRMKKCLDRGIVNDADQYPLCFFRFGQLKTFFKWQLAMGEKP